MSYLAVKEACCLIERGLQTVFFFFSYVGRQHTDKNTERLWVTFSEFQRAAALPEGRQPSLMGALIAFVDM